VGWSYLRRASTAIIIGERIRIVMKRSLRTFSKVHSIHLSTSLSKRIPVALHLGLLNPTFILDDGAQALLLPGGRFLLVDDEKTRARFDLNFEIRLPKVHQ
jgi:hypothetical protein